MTTVDNTNGTWQYSTDGGGSWSAFGTPTAAAARLLGADSANNLIRFVPSANYNGSVDPGLTFAHVDQTAGANDAPANVSTNGRHHRLLDGYRNGRHHRKRRKRRTFSIPCPGDFSATNENTTLTFSNRRNGNPTSSRSPPTSTGRHARSRSPSLTVTNGTATSETAPQNQTASLPATPPIRRHHGLYRHPGQHKHRARRVSTLIRPPASMERPTSKYRQTIRSTPAAEAHPHDVQTIPITVNGVNDAPSITGQYRHDDGDRHQRGRDQPRPAPSPSPTSSPDAGGDRITGVDAGAAEGIAVTTVDNTNGAGNTRRMEAEAQRLWHPHRRGKRPTLTVRRQPPTTSCAVPSANYNGSVDPGLTFTGGEDSRRQRRAPPTSPPTEAPPPTRRLPRRPPSP